MLENDVIDLFWIAAVVLNPANRKREHMKSTVLLTLCLPARFENDYLVYYCKNEMHVSRTY